MIPNRTLCDVLEEMRECYKTHNYSYLMGLVEEAQGMGRRMEAGLWDKSAKIYKLKTKIKKLKGKKK